MKKITAFIACALVAAVSLSHAAGQKLIHVGDTFPAEPGRFPFTADELAYYGIERGLLTLFKQRFSVNDIQSDILVVEFFNTYCTSCQSQAPVLNQVYKAIQKDKDLSAKVRFLGISAGNNDREVSQFKQTHDVPFPLMPDQHFTWYGAIGEPGGTPFMLILKRQGDRFIVVGVHKGLIRESSFFLRTLKTAAEKTAADLNQRVVEQDITLDSSRKLTLSLSPDRQLELVGKSMSDGCSGSCSRSSDIGRVRLSSGQELYTAKATADGKQITLYSRLFSQKPVCDVCHGTHYILTFDSKGYIRDFLPIHLTKYGNVEWNEYDIETMRRQLIGKRVNKDIVFDPTLDAVTSATMSSALIYKGASELQADYRELH